MKGKELLEVAHQRLTYLREFINRIKKANEQVPAIQDMIEQTVWEVTLLEDLPIEAEKLIPSNYPEKYKADNEYLIRNLPLAPAYNPNSVNSTASITTSGSSDMYSILSDAEETYGGDIIAWSSPYKASYRHIQEKQSRFENVIQKMQILNPDRIEELRKAKKLFSNAIANIEERIAAGTAMRNLIEHFKGDLFEMARKHDRENMTWRRMAERLALGDFELDELINQETIWNSLHARLSSVLKNQKSGMSDNLEDIWTNLMDHVFTILGIIKIR